MRNIDTNLFNGFWKIVYVKDLMEIKHSKIEFVNDDLELTNKDTDTNLELQLDEEPLHL